MDKPIQEYAKDLLARLEARDPGLHKEVQGKLGNRTVSEHVSELPTRRGGGLMDADVEELVAGAEDTSPVSPQRVAETIVLRMARPVLLIRDDHFKAEFSEDSEVWRDRLATAETGINAVIPSVGRIEVPGLGIPFLGTGWLVADDILVTNRHVASEFAQRDGQRFVFRLSAGRPLTAQVDFFEEFNRPESREFPITEVLWISGANDPDIAFLRVPRSALGNRLSPRVLLLTGTPPQANQLVAVIGYPATDPTFPDQKLMRQIFGDVFDKKRLAPGQILQVAREEIEHDCSTLGGNSGSVVLDLATGEAIGLHFAGRIFTANFAVAATAVNDRLTRLVRGELVTPAVVGTAMPPAKPPEPPAASPSENVITAKFQIPIEITVRIGAIIQTLQTQLGAGGVSTGGATPDYEAALAEAREYLQHDGDVLGVHIGYRFRRGWITKERAIVIDVKEKLPPYTLRDRGKPEYPTQFRGVGVDVRAAALGDRLRSEGIDVPLVEERVRHGNYVPPADLRLQEVNEEMTAIFHASPDAGFPNLSAFLSRTQRRLIGTMYEAGAQHVRDALVNAIRNANDRLRMVTQNNEGMRDLVDDLQRTLGNKFTHHFASVGGGQLLFPSAYHIKVSVRDKQEMWLSSGNWKESNQPDIDPVGTHETSFAPLRKFNREWHAMIDNPNLATQYDAFIEYDFKEAARVPAPEGLAPALPDLFVPIPVVSEAVARASYFAPKVINRRLRVQPLLTPDNYARHVREVIDSARTSILFQNQSFNQLAENEPQVEELFTLMKDKQRTCEVKIIIRDSREFGASAARSQQTLLERLQDFGFDMDNVRLQMHCHNKGIVVDSAIAVLGSHNWTNEGMLFNRDASLIVFDADVASYFEKIFRFDWEFLAKQESEETVAAVRMAAPGEATPPGMRRVSMEEFFDMES